MFSSYESMYVHIICLHKNFNHSLLQQTNSTKLTTFKAFSHPARQSAIHPSIYLAQPYVLCRDIYTNTVASQLIYLTNQPRCWCDIYRRTCLWLIPSSIPLNFNLAIYLMYLRLIQTDRL